jgi:hypothetical protein
MAAWVFTTLNAFVDVIPSPAGIRGGRSLSTDSAVPQHARKRASYHAMKCRAAWHDKRV